MMDSSPSKMNLQPSLPATSGAKRSAPSLLPAFEPFSSSPALPRPPKRKACGSPSGPDVPYQKYPTPIPTSTTGMLSSSPLPRQNGGPNLRRTQSSLSERAPLSSLRTIILPGSGEEIRLGRSSNSSHFQLSANKLISRVHVKVRYVPVTSPLENERVEITCCGWNGVKVHCQGQSWDLSKGDTITSETESAEIMLDVHDARVIIVWPSLEREESMARANDSSWDEEEDSPSGLANRPILRSSPPRSHHRMMSPVSPTPAGPPGGNFSSLLGGHGHGSVVQIYEDESDSDQNQQSSQVPEASQSTQEASQLQGHDHDQSSDLSEPDDEEPDEENDPIVHSFGPFGANISSRMAFFTAGSSPLRARKPASPVTYSSPVKRSPSPSTHEADSLPVANHVINQLAFSRLSSTPLSVILYNLPATLKVSSASHAENHGLAKDELQKLLVATPCIGEIHREGKDAAGKALESEFYYIPDEDCDAQRKAAVVDGLQKPSLRNCRKQHKQYYWKKPKTP